MKLFGKLLGFAGRNVNPLSKVGGTVPTDMLRTGKVKIPSGFVPEVANELLSSPGADTFIRQGAKGSSIIGDNIVRLQNCAPYRAITKRLPSGTVVTKAFMAGESKPLFTEVIKQDGSKAYNAYRTTVAIPANGKCTVAQYGYANHMYAKPDVAATLASNAVGLTEKANANNKLYQTLLESGMISK